MYRVFGVHESAAHWVNGAAFAMTVCLVSLLAFLLVGNRTAALLAGLLMALTPEQILWSATAAAEPTASLACVGALACAALFVRTRSTAALAAAGVAAAYAVQFRPESLLILLPVAVLSWRPLREEIGRPRVWWVGLLFFGLVAVHIGHTFAVRNEGWGTTDARLSFKYLGLNLPVNLGFFLGDERFPILFSVLAAIGLGIRRRDRSHDGETWHARRAQVPGGRLAMLVYFLAFFGVDLLFYAGSYDYGADVRYSLMTYPPLAVLGGLGASRVLRWVRRVRPALPAELAITGALLFQFLWYVPLVRATGEEAWAARADVRFARSAASSLPDDSYVLTHNPGMFQVWGVNAGQMSLVVSNPGYLDYLVTRFAGGVYLHWNYWCNVMDPVQRSFCQKALALRPAELVRDSRDRGERYALYRFTTPPATADRRPTHSSDRE